MKAKVVVSQGNKKYGIKKVLAAGKSIYHKMPPCLRSFLLPVRLLYTLVGILRVDLWIITGEEISSKQELVIIYAGHEVGKNYLITLAFDSSHRENHIGKKWLWQIPQIVEGTSHDCSLMVTEVSKSFRKLFRKIKCIYVPYWVFGEIDVSSDNHSFLKNNSLKSDLRRIRRNKLHFEVTNSLSQLHNFYYNMYLPYISKAHGNSAVMISYDFVKREFRERGLFADLLLIKKEKEYVAGVLLGFQNNIAGLLYLGVKDANLDYVKDGAIGALYYFSVCYLEGKGFTRIGFGDSKPFLRDGVLRFKRKWDLTIRNKGIRGLVIKPLSRSDGVKGFFINNPLIYEDETGLIGAIFVPGDRSLSKEDFAKIYKDYYIKGLSKLVIYRFGEVNSKTPSVVPEEFSDRIAMCTAESIFQAIEKG